MKLYQVTARDADGCDTAVNAQLTLREARAVAIDWLIDRELHDAGAVRVMIENEATGEVIEDEPMQVAQ